jgi:endonuclease/exonuclease/phosphatase family metal-dependent hydrolase
MQNRYTLKYLLLPLFFLCLSACLDSSDNDGPREATTLKVMSYNLRYGDNGLLVEDNTRKTPLIASIKQHKPDFLGVQEANEPWMQILPQELTDYAFVGVGRDDGETSGERAAIFYRKDKYDVLESGTFWLSDTPEEPSFGWGANHRRICTWAYLRNLMTGEIIAHFNTHLDHQVEEARVNGVELILDRLRRSPYPVVLTGDFNFLEGTDQYKVIEAADMLDTKHTAEVSEPYGTFNFFRENDRDYNIVIDFIFSQKDAFTVKNYRVDHSVEFNGLPVSDHYPVIAELELIYQ